MLVVGAVEVDGGPFDKLGYASRTAVVPTPMISAIEPAHAAEIVNRVLQHDACAASDHRLRRFRP